MDQCRLCASTGTEYFVNVNDVRFANGDELVYYIRETTGIEVMVDDRISKHVCTECINKTVQAYRFRDVAIKTDKQLRLNLLSNKKADQTHLSLDPVYDDEHCTLAVEAEIDDCDIDYNSVKIEDIKTESDVLSVSSPTEEPHKSIQEIIIKYPNLKINGDVLQENLNPTVKLCAQEVDSYIRKALQENADDTAATKMEIIAEEIIPALSPVILKSQRIYVCDLCSEIFESKRKFIHHRTKHNVCRHCKLRFKRNVSLKSHLERKCKVLYPKGNVNSLACGKEHTKMVKKYCNGSYVENTENSNVTLPSKDLVQPRTTDSRSVGILQNVLIKEPIVGTKNKDISNCLLTESTNHQQVDCSEIVESQVRHPNNPQTETNKCNINNKLLPEEVPLDYDLSPKVEIAAIKDLNTSRSETLESDDDIMEITDLQINEYDSAVTIIDDLSHEEFQRCKQAFRQFSIGKKSDKSVDKITLGRKTIAFHNLYKDLLENRIDVDFRVQEELDANITNNPKKFIPPLPYDYSKVSLKEIKIPDPDNFVNSASQLQQEKYSPTKTNLVSTNGSRSAVTRNVQQHPNRVTYQSSTPQEPRRGMQHYEQQFRHSQSPQFFKTTQQPQMQQNRDKSLLYHMLKDNRSIRNQSSYSCTRQQIQLDTFCQNPR